MKPHQPYTPHQQPPPRSYPIAAAVPQQPPRGNPHAQEYRPKGQAPPPQQNGPPDSPQTAGPPHGMDIHAPVFRPSGGFGVHPPPVRSGYNGPVFTPGQGLGPAPGMNGMPQQMRGPPGPHHHQQPHRMRGPPRGGMQQQYMPPPQMGQPYYPPQMQQMPPPYMMNQQYMGPPPQIQFMGPPMGIPYGMPMPAPAPAPTQTQTHVVPRERRCLEIIDPKTNKPIQLGSASSTSSSTSSAATTESTTSKAKVADAPTPTPDAEKKVEASAAKKTASSSPVREAKQANGVAKSPSKSPKKATPAAATPAAATPAAATPAAATPPPAPAAPATNGAKAAEAVAQQKPVATDSPKPQTKSPKKTAAPSSEAVSSPKPSSSAKSVDKAAPSSEAVSSPKPSSSAKSVDKKAEVSTVIKQTKTISPKKKTPEPTQETVASVEIKSTTTETTRVETKTTVEKVAAPSKVEKSKDVAVVVKKTDGKVTYTLELLMSLREKYTELPAAAQGPDSKWPSMEVVNEGPVRSGSRGGRGGGGGGWERGEKQLSRQSSRSSSTGNGGGSQWQRSQELPKRGRGGERGGRGGRGGRGQPDPPLFDGPVKPLERTANRWIPVKAESGLEAAKKKVQSIMNKMTREKFDRLAEQLTNIHMDSLEMLQSVIRIIFDKALGEPHFCDMYADLCVHLDQKWHTWSFLKIVRNDDDNKFYWTTMSDADSEVVGPFDSSAEALQAADSDDFEPSPAPSNLKLTEVRVQNQKFVKVWTLDGEGGSAAQYYWSGQHMDDLGDDQVLNGPFPTEEVANRHAIKSCSFKRILLNACQEEFEKDNIYEELEANFKKAKEDGEVTPEIEADYEEKRIIMKGRMLGNIRFIGELYRKGMLQERIMHECIMKLMGVHVNQAGELVPTNPTAAPDEENIESLSKLLSTMGKDLDHHGQQGSMQSYFHYLGTKLVKDKRLSSRINFMIRDVIELRKNKWVPRRKELKTKTLDEIRKEAEREQRAPPASAPSGGGGRNDSFRGMDNRRSNSARDGGNFSRSTMAQVYQGHSMNSRSASSNRMTLPIDRSRAFQRDESVKTGPQGRPASFGNAARRGAPQPSPSSMGARRGAAPDAAASAKKKTEQDATKRASVPPLSEDDKEKIEKKAKSIAEEYVSIDDIAEADGCLQDLLKTYNNHEDVSRVFAAAIMAIAIEEKAAVFEKQVELLEKLSTDKRSLSFDGIRHGLEKTLEVATFLWCDVPKLHEHVASICVTYMVDSPHTGVTLDWILSGCGNRLESNVMEGLADEGFLAAVSGYALKLLASKSIEKAKQELHNTYITLFSVLPEHQQTAKDLKAWSDKYLLSEVLALDPAFELAAQLTSNAEFNDVVQWIEKHIPRELRVDSVFATYVCLLILSAEQPGELPSSERCMLLTGFCSNVDIQTRLVAAVIQTRKDRDEAKKLLRHLVKEGAVLPPACAKWLELKKDNSVGRKQAVADLGRFIEDLARTK